MIVLIDDSPQKEINLEVKFDVVLRTFEAGRMFLYQSFKGLISSIYFDHDLGSENPKETGYELLKIGLENALLPDKIFLVTNNPIGKINMKNLLIDYNYTFDNKKMCFIKKSRTFYGQI